MPSGNRLTANYSKFLGQLIRGPSAFIPSCLTCNKFMNSYIIFALVN